MSFLKNLFDKKKPTDAPNESSGSIQKCQICGQPLDPKISGQVAQFLELSWWPCPKCHLRAETVVASERGVIAERKPLLVTIRRKPDRDYEVLIGVGSIKNPAKKTIEKDEYVGRDALFDLIDALDPKNEDKLVQLLKG